MNTVIRVIILMCIISFNGPVLVKAQNKQAFDVFDVVITEIYADPDPLIGLPEVEFVELYNRSSASVNLLNWVFADKTSQKVIETAFELAPDSYVILTKTSNIDLLTAFGQVVGLHSFPSLNNSADQLKLIDVNGQLVHQVNYSNNWHEAGKTEGGWSLEMIDPNNTCEAENNWSSSIDASGGTPGKINSIDAVNIDITPPTILSVNITEVNQIAVKFTESLAALLVAEKYLIKNENDTYTIKAIEPCETDPTTCISITLNLNLPEGTPIYISASELFDCAGNQISNQAFPFIQSATILPGDILINEILFDPPSSAEDFIELYNNSNKFFDLNTLSIADYGAPVLLYLNQNILSPKQYIALTTNKQALLQYYQPPAEANIVELSKLPSFNNDKDLIILRNNNGEVIDSLTYNQSWHFGLLDNTDGVSLERINLNQPSHSASNWQSAAATVNYATPGYQNSQSYTGSAANNMLIQIEQSTVSPDNDGFEDYLHIQYSTKSAGWVGNIQIFDQRGRFIAHPTKNELLAENGTIKWDGLSENGARLPLGIYIVYAEFFDLLGQVEKHKLPIIIAGKL